jgi:diadenosine tetraphosphate (Ap4A) HIT family hydrolase
MMAQWVSEMISSPDQRSWEKPDPEHTFRGRLDGTRTKPDEVVYEDDDVFAFRHNVDRSKEEWWEVHVVIIPKKWIPTILDLGLGDAEIWHRLVAGIQKVGQPRRDVLKRIFKTRRLPSRSGSMTTDL